MVVQQSLQPRAVKANAGKSYRVVDDIVTIIASGEDTGGAYALFEVRTPPDCGTPPHLERNDDESFYVLEGTFSFQVGDATHVLSAGDYVMITRNTPHWYRNVGETSGRLLVVTTPGGYHEHFFAEAGDPVADALAPEPPTGPPDFDRILAAGAKYGIEVLPPPGE